MAKAVPYFGQDGQQGATKGRKKQKAGQKQFGAPAVLCLARPGGGGGARRRQIEKIFL